MNTSIKPLKLTSVLALALLTIPCLSAQDADTTQSPTGGTGSQSMCGKKGHIEGHFGDRHILTPAEWQELATARKAVASQDPALIQSVKAAEEAMEKAHQAMKDAMLKTDPNLAAIFQKLEAARPHRPDGDSPTGGAQPAENSDSN